ncbi:hypothetical protein U9M48_030896, partial [Paspalum notatum var. saurae]
MAGSTRRWASASLAWAGVALAPIVRFEEVAVTTDLTRMVTSGMNAAHAPSSFSSTRRLARSTSSCVRPRCLTSAPTTLVLPSLHLESQSEIGSEESIAGSDKSFVWHAVDFADVSVESEFFYLLSQ